MGCIDFEASGTTPIEDHGVAKTIGVAAVPTVAVGRPMLAHSLTLAAITQASITIDRFLPTGCDCVFRQTE